MADRTFDIEILIKARNAASKALNDLVKDVGKAEDKFEDLNKKTQAVNRNVDATGKKFEDLKTRTSAFSREMLTAGNRMSGFNDRFKEMSRSTGQLNRDMVKLHEGTTNAVRQMDHAIEQLNKRMVSHVVASRQAGDATGSLEDDLKKLDIEFKRKPADVDRAGKSIDKYSESNRRASQSTRQTGRDTNQLGGILGRLNGNTRGSAAGFNNLATSINRFQVAAAIKYAQALTTGVIALGGELTSLSSSAISAGSALGAGLATGAAQAIGPVALLAGTLSRITAIGKILNLKQTIDANALHTSKRGGGDTTTEAANNDRLAAAVDRVSSANEQLVGAEERVRNAHDAVNDAQKNLTNSRVDAKRKIEDLIDAQRRARLAEEGSSLSLEDAQRARRGTTGLDFQNADLDVARARLDLSNARRDSQRTTTDARTAINRGVDKSPEVLSATRTLQDANRQLASSERAVTAAHRQQEAASRGTAKAHRDTATGANAATAAQDRLVTLLGQLTPAERHLYDSLQKLHTVYKRAFRPVTDVIIQSFSEAVDKVIPLFSNQKIIKGFDELAGSVSQSIGRITKQLTSTSGQNFLAGSISDSADTIPRLTDAVGFLLDAFKNIAKEGKPIFDFLVNTAVKLAQDFDDVTKNTGGLRSFLRDALSDLKAFFGLAGAVFNIITAIFDPARDEGRKTIQGWTDGLKKFGESLHNNQAGVRQFFANSRAVFNDIVGVVLHLGRTIFTSFQPASVHAFADFLNHVIIPALGETIRVMGALAQAFHTVFALKGVSDVARFVATIALITAGFGIIGNAVNKIRGILGLFYVTLVGAGPFSRFKAALTLAVAVMALFGHGVDGMKKAIAAFLFALAVERVVAFFRAIMTGVQALAAGATVAGLTNPWIALLEAIGLVVAAVITLTHTFQSENAKKARSVEEVTNAIRDQQDALRTLHDLELEGKNRKLDVAAAESRVARARHDEAAKAAQVTQPDSQGGATITKKEARDLRDLRIARQQAENDLERARRSSKRFTEDKKRSEDDVRTATKKRVDGDKTDVEVTDKAVKKAQEKVDKIKDETVVGNRFSTQIEQQRDHNKRLADAEKDLASKAGTNKKAHDELKSSLHEAAKGFTEIGGNAEAFGLTFSDVLQFLESGTNDGLKQFGAKPVHFAKKFSPKSSSKLSDFIPGAGEFKAEGGIIGGSGLYDTVPVMAAPGEGFLTRHQMPIVDDALRYSGMSGGLDQLFSTVSTPHWMARGGRAIQKFAKGGGVDVKGSKPGFSVLMELFQKLFSNKLFVLSGNRPGSRVEGSGAVSNHASGDAIDISMPGITGATQSNPPESLSKPEAAIMDRLHAYIASHIPKPPRLDFLWRTTQGGNHFNHIHLGISAAVTKTAALMTKFLKGVKGSASSFIPGFGDAGTGADAIQIPHIAIGGPHGAIGDLINKASNRVRALANKAIRKAGGDTLAESVGSTAAGAIPGIGDVIGNINKRFPKHFTGQPGAKLSEKQVRQVMGTVNFPSQMLSIAKRESGWQPGIVGRDPGGTLGYGLWQNTTKVNGPAFDAVVQKLGGWDEMLNPYKNARAAKWLYDRGGLSHWSATASRGGKVIQRFARGGAVGLRNFANGGGNNKDEESRKALRKWKKAEAARIAAEKIPGYGDVAIEKLRLAEAAYKKAYMKWFRAQQHPRWQGQWERQENSRGGIVHPLRAFARGGSLGGMLHRAGGGGVPKFQDSNTIATIFSPFLDDIAAIGKKSSGLALMLKALRDLVADNGPLGLFAQAFQDFQGKLASKLQQRIFKTKPRPGGGVTVTRALTDEQEGEAQLENLQAERVELRGQSSRTSTAERAAAVVQFKARGELRKAQRGDDPAATSKARKRYNQAVKNRKKLVQGKATSKAALAQNAQDIFDKQEAIKEARQAAILKAENDKVNALNDSFGQQNFGLDAADRQNAAFGNQSNNAALDTNRRNTVSAQIAQASNLLGATTDPGLRSQLQSQINDLSLQMIDLAAKIVEDQIETVNKTAARSLGVADRVGRTADLLTRQTAGGFEAASGVRASSLNIRGNALSTQVQGLTAILGQLPVGSDKYNDLIDQIDELNVQISENNQAIRDNTDQLQTSRFERSQGTFGFTSGVLSSGVSLITSIGSLLGHIVDNPAIVSLLNQGKAGLGRQRNVLNNQLKSQFGFDVSGQSGNLLIQSLAKISNIDTSNFTPAQESLFRNLINALLENETAVVANTKQLEEITANQNIQTFNSTSWQLFRSAVFNGANGLVPSLANLTPMATGGMVKSGGAFWLHPGEKVTSKSEVENGGDTHYWNITSPTEVLDPDYISTVMSFKRSNTRATQ